MAKSLITLILTAMLICGAGWLAATAGDDSAATEAGRHAAFLKWETGVWDATITVIDPASGEPASFSGEQVDRLGACGGWLITDLKMTAAPGEAPPPYRGHGVLGFDPAKRKLVGIWIDPHTDWLAAAEGSVDAEGRRLVLHVEGRDPATGERMDRRFITTRIGENARRLEVVVPGPAGDVTMATIDYARRVEP